MLKRIVAAAVAVAFMGLTASASAAPVIKDSWDWQGVGAGYTTDVSMFDYSLDGSGPYERQSVCNAATMFMSCIAYPGGKGAIIKAKDAPGYTNSFANYTYTVPGGPDAYIDEISAEALNVTGETLGTLNPGLPAATMGLWNGSAFLGQQSTINTGTVAMSAVAGGPAYRQFRFGLVNFGTGSPPETHWAGMTNMDVTLGDDVDPEFEVDEGTLPNSWVDENPIHIPYEASDDGLGLKDVALFSSGRSNVNPWNTGSLYFTGWDGTCVGNTDDPCPLVSPEDEFVVDPTELREGQNLLTMFTWDSMENISDNGTPVEFHIKVDTMDPTMTLGGDFMSQPGMVMTGPSYDLDVEARDGETGKENSGVIYVQLRIDGSYYAQKSQFCLTENCPIDWTRAINTAALSNGDHQLEVRVSDAVGHIKSQFVDFEVDH